MLTDRTTCRACGSSELVEVFDLGIQPPANDFTLPGEPRKGYAPLKVNYCTKCSLAQLSVVYDPKILYADYPYVTSKSETMKAHFMNLGIGIATALGQDLFDLSIMEIGSNDGTLLQYFKDIGVKKVLGVEPAENLSEIAVANGIDTINDFFGPWFSKHIGVDFEHPDIIIARHVFAHIDDWKGFIEGLNACCHDKTLIFIEVPDAQKMIEMNSFDQIYHEHLSYVNPRAVAALLKDTGFHIHKVISYPIHGGSMGIVIRKFELEKKIEYHGPVQADWLNFSKRCDDLIGEMQDAITRLERLNTVVAGYGASAKSSVWINACGWSSKHIKFIVDNTIQKQNRLSPGSDIPIVPESELLKRMPDYCIIFSWNFAEEIIAKNQDYIKAGGKFIVPLPMIKIVP